MYSDTPPRSRDPLQVAEVKAAYWMMQAAGVVAPPSGTDERVTDDGSTRVTDDGGTRVVIP